VDGLEPLAVDAGQEVEIVRVDGTVAELFHPVALELEEPAEGEIRVDEPAVEPAPDERAEPVQPREAGQRAQGAEAVAAARGGIGGGKLGVLRREQGRHVEPRVVVQIHILDSRGTTIAAERSPALFACQGARPHRAAGGRASAC
jgi:hypothetical protein